MIFYIHSILLHSIYTLDDPLEAIKPHPIWTMYVQNSRRECLYLYKPPPLPANKWSNHLLINFTRLKVRYIVLVGYAMVVLTSQIVRVMYTEQKETHIFNGLPFCITQQ